MGFLQRIFGGYEERASESEGLAPQVSEALLKVLLSEDFSVSEDAAMRIPPVASAVNLISTTVANVKYKLYYYDEKGRLTEAEDERSRLFNHNTRDLLNGFEMKRAFIKDYLLNGNGYIYKEQRRNRVTGLYYVDSKAVSVNKNSDSIYKKAIYLVDGRSYAPYEFITIARSSADGVTGKGLTEEGAFIVRLVNNMLKTIDLNSMGGGLGKGVLQSTGVLNDKQFEELKEKFKTLYSNESSAFLVLNKGLTYQSIPESSIEAHLHELYESIGKDISEILLVPETVLNGKATDSQYRCWFKNCIMPILGEICGALDESLLLESEKGRYFWKADTSELENGDLKSMFEAYGAALGSNILQLDEVREKLGYAPTGFNYIKIGLDSVLVDPEKGIIYTPNTNAMQKMTDIDSKIAVPSDEKGAEQ